MTRRIYEINILRGHREVREINPFLVAVDWDEVAETEAVLNRHLRGAALRDRARRSDMHLYHLEGRDIDSSGRGTGRPVFRWAQPAEDV